MRLRLLNILLVPCLFSEPLPAQAQTGRINGAVTNATGMAVPSATVKATSRSTGAVFNVKVAGDGEYTLPDLVPGGYTVAVSAPGFVDALTVVNVGAAARLTQNFELGTPFENATATQKTVINQNELQALPNLGRNPYRFADLAGNVSDAGLGTRGAGVAINGQREASTDIQLDGGTNNDEFAGSIGQQIPLDAVREVIILTSNFTAEYGRASGGIVNVVSMTGGNDLHGTAYEFNRVSRLASGSFKDNASGVAEAAFALNQFGYSLGGPIRGKKVFFFSATEWTDVRGDSMKVAWVPTQQLLGQTAPNTQAFFQALGQLRADARTIGVVSLSDLTAIYGKSPCTGLACATLPAGLPLFNHVAYKAPADSGGGVPRNTWDTLQRVDYNLSDRTRIYARYAVYSEDDRAGDLSNSPYNNYDLGQTALYNNVLVSVSHTWSPRWTSRSKAGFNRFTIFQQGLTSRGVVPGMYANLTGPVAIGHDDIAFPGYNPFSPGSGGAFGGPQNTLQFSHDVSWTRGNHSIRFGGAYDYLRDNRTNAAYQTSVNALSNGEGLGSALNGLISGRFAQIEVAIDPQGQLPCVAGGSGVPCSVTLPVRSPDFSRSNRLHDGALYVQDFWRVRRRLAVNVGLRWEHFGVQHNKNSSLDSNWYAPGTGFADDNLGTYLRNGGLQLAPKSPTGGLWNPDWKDFAPRVGVAWDIFGHGTTVLRGGYGIGYEKNFGNVTFNVIQNPPGYALLDVPGPISTNNFGPLAGSGTVALPRAGARIIDPDLKTAHAHFWNASLQRGVARGIVYSAEYSGSRGVDLYSISYPNQFGLGNFALGDPCVGNGDCASQPNPNYSENVGYRGNQGFSIYHSLNNRLTVNNFLNRGITLTVNYTWSHAIDNLSSTFFEAGGQGVANQFGDRNITINNGNFDKGLLDPYHPNLDRGDAEFDIRHRVTLSGDWKVSLWKMAGWKGSLLRGWSVSPILSARSGQPFSVFDTGSQTLDLNAPRAVFTRPVPNGRNSFVASTTPDTFHLLTFLPAQIASKPNPLTPGAPWPGGMSGRDGFRAPGFWNVDLGVSKDTRLTDRFTLQFRAEAFNLLNHANLYVIGASADVGAGNSVDACFGCTGSTYDRRYLQLAAKVIF